MGNGRFVVAKFGNFGGGWVEGNGRYVGNGVDGVAKEEVRQELEVGVGLQDWWMAAIGEESDLGVVGEAGAEEGGGGSDGDGEDGSADLGGDVVGEGGQLELSEIVTEFIWVEGHG